METIRFILLIALGLVLTMIWQAWQEDYGQSPMTEVVMGSQQAQSPGKEQQADIPDTNISVNEASPISRLQAENNLPTKGDIVRVKTDVLDVQINTMGATIQELALTNYPVKKNKTDESVLLLKNNSEEFYLFQSGLLSKQTSANHKTLYQTEQSFYELSGDSLDVAFVWRSDSGIDVIKTFRFNRGSYLVELKHDVVNQSGETWSGSAYAQLNRTDPADSGSPFLYTYTGAVISTPETRYEKISFDDIKKESLSIEVSNGWVAMLQHYFFSALLPGNTEDVYRYYTLNPGDKSYVIGSVTPSISLAVGENASFQQKMFFGPKLQKQLDEIADGLELTVDYGMLWFIAKPLYWVLDKIHAYTGNWGWSIILLTLLIKIAFYRLSAAGYRSMANMRRVQPRLVAIKERYENDRARLNQAMMDIYKEEKINPLGGCFPILIQIPVFIALYWVLLETVELRQSPFMFWINDLSTKDPYFVLPLLMGISMFVQQKLNPAPMDPIQAKVMSILPIMFTVFFAFFPSGLVLYWVVNNVLSIAQQWMITRSIEKTKPA